MNNCHLPIHTTCCSQAHSLSLTKMRSKRSNRKLESHQSSYMYQSVTFLAFVATCIFTSCFYVHAYVLSLVHQDYFYHLNNLLAKL